MESKQFLHFSLVNKLGLVVSEKPKQFSAYKNFTFYRIEKEVEKGLTFTFYITNLDIRCEKGGSKDGIIPDNCWCLFTFYKGKRALQFLNIEMFKAMSIEALNSELDKMFNKLAK